MLRELVKIAQAKKYKAKIEQGGINLDGKLYLPHQFHLLPEGLKPHDACTVQTDDEGIAFASEWSAFSNLYRTDFYYHGIWYNSVEQCYQFLRANAEGHEDLADLILALTDPYQCKKMGDQEKQTEEWDKVCDQTMARIVQAKFEQNEGIFQLLLDTSGPLYEATADTYWGVGLSLRSKDVVAGKGTGENKLGKILVALRDGPEDSQSNVPSNQSNPPSDHESSPDHSTADQAE